MRPLVWSAVLVTCVATQDAQPQFRARTDLIRLDVAVLYPDRRPVRGLETRHFVVLEDGVEQPVETFAEVALAEPEPLPDGWQRDTAADVTDNSDAPNGRLVAIVIDDSDAAISADAADATRRVASDVVARLSPGDRAAVMFARHQQLASVVTSDRAQLLAAINRKSVGGGLPRTAVGWLSTAMAARTAAQALGTANDRRKIVIIVSRGTPIDMTKLLYDHEASIYWEVDAAVGIADRDNVSIYAIDPTVLISEPLLTSREIRDRDRRRTFLTQFSEWGFGFAAVDAAGYDTALTRIFREHTGYYTLGYRAPLRDRNKRGKPPAVEVRVKRQGLLVRARTTRVDQPAGDTRSEPAKNQPSKALRDVQLSVLPQTDLRIRVAAAVFRGPGKNEGVATITTEVGAPDESDLGDGETINVATRAIQPFAESRERDRVPPSDYRTAPQKDAQAIEIHSQLLLKPGYQRIDVAAERARLGRRGSIRVPLDVPDFERDRFAVSGVIVNAPGTDAASMPPALAAILPFAPTTRRTFTASEPIRVFLQVYVTGPPPMIPVTITARVKDAGGQSVFEESRILTLEQFDRRGVASYTLEPRLGSLAPGPHLLSIDAKRDQTTLTREVRFEIR